MVYSMLQCMFGLTVFGWLPVQTISITLVCSDTVTEAYYRDTDKIITVFGVLQLHYAPSELMVMIAFVFLTFFLLGTYILHITYSELHFLIFGCICECHIV